MNNLLKENLGGKKRVFGEEEEEIKEDLEKRVSLGGKIL